jgi:hypothetical protein
MKFMFIYQNERTPKELSSTCSGSLSLLNLPSASCKR